MTPDEVVAWALAGAAVLAVVFLAALLLAFIFAVREMFNG